MNRNRFRGNRNHQQHRNDRKNDAVATDEDNPVVKSFRQYSVELCDKHDRYERIIKLSRDITIESKRLIFLLHTVDDRKPNHEKILDEARTRLAALCTNNFAAIAKELQNLDPYQYARAYSPGLQEFVEAWTYYDYLSRNGINDWNDLQQKLTYDVTEEQSSNMEPIAIDEPTIETAEPAEKKQQGVVKSILCLVQPVEFMLGLADLSGEVMRKCVNSLGSGDIDACFNASNFLQSLYSGYLSLGQTRNREMSRKIFTMRQSLLKVENVCYNVKVRGGEAAKWGSDDHLDKPNADEDEGFINY